MTTKWEEPATKVDRFWCDEARNIRCVREADYDALLQRLHESLEKHRATLSMLEQKERECEELRSNYEALKGLYKMHAAYETREMQGLRDVVGDLAALVRKLVQHLRKAAPNDDLSEKALDYLRRKGLQGSPYRGEESAKEDTK